MSAVWRAWCCLVVVVALGVVTPTAGRVFNTSDYLQQRRTLLAKEQTDILASTGQAQVLTAAEEEVNKVLMGAKGAEMDAAFETLNFLPAQNFLTVVGEVEASQVYKMIQHMPKGAALHVHETALTSASWVVQEITYWPNLYMCYDAADHLLFKFFEVPDTSCTWELVSEVRDNYVDPQDFDDMIFSRLTLLTDNPDDLTSDQRTPEGD
ncbi:Adenosine deaminase 2 [Chionoecetes opilio]|uniref:Adenosine deaminase 2 n=1 Tax=Chionoecetes opilio TaxID=41210 RepID=A0A8J4YGZ1_CHIOP|nr:Adenosine deaminase 2 [Chionoecetes opilio]